MGKRTVINIILSTLATLLLLLLSTSCTQLPKPPDEVSIDYSRTYSGEFYQNVRISENTKIVPKSTSDRIETLTESEIVFNGNDTFLNALKPNDIVIVAPFRNSKVNAPFGILRRIVNKRTADGKIVLETTYAAMDEVFVSGTISVPIVDSDLTPLDSPDFMRNSVKVFSLVDDFYRAASIARQLVDWVVTLREIFDGTQIQPTFDLNNPNLNMTVNFERKSISLTFEQSANLGLSGRLQINVPATTVEATLVTLDHRKQFFVGPVPVVFRVNLVATAKVDVTGRVIIPFQFSLQPSFTYNYSYRLGDILPNTSVNWDLRPSGSIGPLDIAASFGVDFQMLRPSLTVYPYDLPCGFRLGFGPGFGVSFDLLTRRSSAKIFLEIFGGYSSRSRNLRGFFKELNEALLRAAQFQQKFEVELPINVPSPNNNVFGRVVDAGQKLLNNRIVPIPDVRVKVYRLGSSTLEKELLTDADGNFQTYLPGPQFYRFEYEKTGYLKASQTVNVLGIGPTQVEQLLFIDNSYLGTGEVGGRIRDSVTYAAVPGVSVKLRRGLFAREGEVVAETTTNAEGIYRFSNLQAGYYTADLSKQGYNREYFNVFCLGGQSVVADGLITPVLPENEWRIVLTWGQNPADLDAHLKGPLSDGSRFHLYWLRRYVYDGGVLVAQLDRDDIDSYGPETVTIHQLRDGLYNYYVHDYTNRHNPESRGLENSDAQVRVYRGSNLVHVFNVPSGAGTVWHVFKIENGVLVPVNTILPNDSGIQSIPSKDTLK